MSERKKSGGKYQVEQLQAIKREWYGGKCMFIDEDGKKCTCSVNLQLAHAVQTPLSKKKPNGSRSSWERLQDTIRYPERLLLLCVKHHFLFDGREAETWIVYYGRNRK